MGLAFAKHQQVSLKHHSDFSEAWLHERVCDDTSLLGLGDLDVIERERPQYSGGRLDILLADSENNARYEVEIMLGATDPSHIIRCIEYWDIERRRYPAYDHVAVIIAEEITSRFLNVMGLLAGSIPLIAIQLNALQVGDQIVLNFVKVLDQQMLREDDTADTGGGDVDRNWWEARKGADKVQMCDRLLQIACEATKTPLQLQYKKTNISLGLEGSFFNVGVIWPKQKFIWAQFKISEASNWVERFEEAGIGADERKANRVRTRLTVGDFEKHEDLISEFVQQAICEYET